MVRVRIKTEESMNVPSIVAESRRRQSGKLSRGSSSHDADWVAGVAGVAGGWEAVKAYR